MCEHLEGGAQEVDEVHEVTGGAAIRLGHTPLIVGKLDELVDLLVQLGVDLPFGRMAGILQTMVETSQSPFGDVWFGPFNFKLAH